MAHEHEDRVIGFRDRVGAARLAQGHQRGAHRGGVAHPGGRRTAGPEGQETRHPQQLLGYGVRSLDDELAAPAEENAVDLAARCLDHRHVGHRQQEVLESLDIALRLGVELPEVAPHPGAVLPAVDEDEEDNLVLFLDVIEYVDELVGVPEAAHVVKLDESHPATLGGVRVVHADVVDVRAVVGVRDRGRFGICHLSRGLGRGAGAQLPAHRGPREGLFWCGGLCGSAGGLRRGGPLGHLFLGRLVGAVILAVCGAARKEERGRQRDGKVAGDRVTHESRIG